MSLTGIVNTARSLSYYLRRQEVVANNLANANTDAFKADRITARNTPDAEHPVPIQTTDLQQGAFRDTGRPLDIGIDGPGFLVVQTQDGERLTRGGSLKLDTAGRLTDSSGNPLLGDDGPVLIHGSAVEVQADGSVVVDGTSAGRLRLVDADDPASLLKEGYGRFRATGALHPAGEGVARLRQGAVEEANLDPLLSMVDLVSIQRAYAANADALRTMDGVLGVIAGEVGKV